MAGIAISRQAAEYIISKRMARPNVIVYRDIIFAGPSAALGAFIFSMKVRVKGEEPNEMFDIVGNDYKIPIWVEKGLLNNMKHYESFVVTLKGGMVKRLKIEKCSQMEEIGTEQIGGGK